MSNKEGPLEYGLVADIPRTKAAYQQLLRFQWEYFSELAFLRNQIYDSLKSSLAERTKPFSFTQWQRAVKYKYSLEPLSPKGSLADPGGRFNIGAIDTTRFTLFPGLYMASDKETALAELLGRDDREKRLTPLDLALTKPDSVTMVSVSGMLESAIDLRAEDNLAPFVDLIKDFQLSRALTKKAKNFGPSTITLIRTPRLMAENLLAQNWRVWPMQYDVPAPSQIFGQIAMDAGIEGIVYGSVLTQQPCLAIFPQNFNNSSSFVELDDPLPSETVQRRIDSSTFKDFA